VDGLDMNNRDLSINKYKEVERVKVEYEPTDVILARLEETERQILREMDELRSMLKEE
jgi:type I restriction enzyme M protein